MNKIVLYLKGMAMGAADVVPGVSGGTIAFIAGIYEELLDSLKNINLEAFKKLFREGFGSFWAHMNGKFLIILFAGILTSIFSLAYAINYLLETQAILVWSFFFGLIVASAWLIGKSIEKWNIPLVAGLLLGTAIAYYITITGSTQTTEAGWFIFLSGALAICAMILPGISGSFILLLLGKYKYIIESLTELRLDVIILFALGCVVGLLSFARLLSWMFKHYKNLTIALLTGFMIGSLNKVWPWKRDLETTIDRHGEEVAILQESILPTHFEGDAKLIWAIVLAFAGFMLIYLLESKASKKSAI